MSFTISDDDRRKIEQIAGDSVAAFIRDLPKFVRDLLEKAVASLIGLDKGWNDWKVDHCNGRRSTIIEIVERRCKAEIEEVVQPIVAAALADLKKDKRFLGSLAQEVRQTFHYTLKHELPTPFEILGAMSKMGPVLITPDITVLGEVEVVQPPQKPPQKVHEGNGKHSHPLDHAGRGVLVRNPEAGPVRPGVGTVSTEATADAIRW